MAVSASEFAEKCGHYHEEAQRAPVAIISDGRISGYFVSERDYQKLQRLRNVARRVYRLGRLPAALAKVIEASAMDPKHVHLNALLDHE